MSNDNEADNDMGNVLELKDYFPNKRFGPGEWIEQEIQDGATFEEILENFDLSPGEVFEFLLNAGKIDEDILITMLTID